MRARSSAKPTLSMSPRPTIAPASRVIAAYSSFSLIDILGRRSSGSSPLSLVMIVLTPQRGTRPSSDPRWRLDCGVFTNLCERGACFSNLPHQRHRLACQHPFEITRGTQVVPVDDDGCVDCPFASRCRSHLAGEPFEFV